MTDGGDGNGELDVVSYGLPVVFVWVCFVVVSKACLCTDFWNSIHLTAVDFVFSPPVAWCTGCCGGKADREIWRDKESSACLLASLCAALLCFAWLGFALLCVASLTFALRCSLRFALLCSALLCFALLCFALLCFAPLFIALGGLALLRFVFLAFLLLCDVLPTLVSPYDTLAFAAVPFEGFMRVMLRPFLPWIPLLLQFDRWRRPAASL